MTIFAYIGILTVIVLTLWIVYRFVRFVMDAGLIATLLFPLYIVGVLISPKFRNKHHRN